MAADTDDAKKLDNKTDVKSVKAEDGELEIKTQTVMVNAEDLVKALGVKPEEKKVEPTTEELALDYAPNGGIFKLDEDGEFVNSEGMLVDEEGYLIEEEAKKGRRRR